jgi:type II secretory pathway component PulF
MPRIAYSARTLTGDIINGKSRAANSDALRLKLSQKGMELLEVLGTGTTDATDDAKEPQPTKKKASTNQIPFTVSLGVSKRAILAFTGQMALMLRTGNALVDALELLAQEAKDQRLAGVLSTVSTDVQGGASLAQALSAHPRVFNGFYISAVRAGEASGRLPDVFEQIQEYLEKRADLRSTVVTALIYPCIIVALAVVAVSFIVAYVLPKFVTIFERSNVVLPLPTRILMSISSSIWEYWYLYALIGAGIPTGIYLLCKQTYARNLLHRLVLTLPVVGNVAKTIQCSIILRTLGTLLDSGVSLVESLDVAKDACSNRRYAAMIDDLEATVIRGESLASGFVRSPLFDAGVTQMITTGERTGSLATVTLTVSEHLDKAAEKHVKRLSAMFEPMTIVAMGAVIGFIAVAVLMPLFKLTSAARGGA